MASLNDHETRISNLESNTDTGVRLGSQGALGDVWGNFSDHLAPTGCVITGLNGGRDGDTVDIRNTYYRPVQIYSLTSGTWLTVAQA